MMTNQQAAELGRLIQVAMDLYVSDPTSLAPTLNHPWLSPWKIAGYLTATDCIWRSGKTVLPGSEVCYGFLAESDPGVFVAVIRGTDGIVEWIEDGDFVSVSHPEAGHVEAGFWGIYSSMQYRPLAGAAAPAAQGIAAAVGTGSVTVIGHSLGSALATYLTFDLARADRLGSRAQGCFWASPRPGDADFANAFDARVASYQLRNYSLDVVPRVPFGDGYTALPKATLIETDEAQARISFGLACGHHLLSYLAMMNYDLTDWKAVPSIDQSCAACIKGPSTSKAQLCTS